MKKRVRGVHVAALVAAVAAVGVAAGLAVASGQAVDKIGIAAPSQSVDRDP